ncbi:rho-associated protein kinase 1 [Patella vulgata]|uniref:rho-associated protein kinase 1 n=1 Tax=Patella vulgata TaxID=6465 RepID=UPI00217F287D|nr:rho-associated protein kinase 1 [Patella vulgata]
MEKNEKDFSSGSHPRNTDDMGDNISDSVPGKWIADLFSPTFDMEVVIRAAKDGGEMDTKINRWNALDAENIQQIYQKVRLMKLLDEEIQKQNCERQGLTRKTTESDVKLDLQQGQEMDLLNDPSTTSSTPTMSRHVRRNLEKHDGNDELQNSVIWDSEELGVLRKVFRSAKDEISDLKVKLRETEERNKYLENTVKKLEYALEKNTVQLTEANKANGRLKIHCDNLQHQLDHSSAKLDTVTDMWKEIDMEKNKMMKDMHEMRVTYDKDQLLLKNTNLKLESEIREKERAVDMAVQNTKIKYEKQLMNLHEQLEKQTDDFHKAEQTYSVTSKSLKQLRHHFSSLPLNNIIPPNSVIEDEVPHVDHIS